MTFAAGIADVLGAAALILCIPLAILVIGIPLALFARGLLWLAGML